jgi:hypothetical protein
MSEIRVNSWKELQDVLFEGWWNEKIHRYRAPYAYRGMSNADYKLDTSLIRLCGNINKLESHLLMNFNKYGTQFMEKDLSIWHVLTLAQHHGLPTRLLDWTYSPLVSLHFATANTEHYNKDGVVWVVEYAKMRSYLPDLLREKLASEDSHVFTVEMLTDLFPGENALKKFSTLNDKPFGLFLEPPSLDDRIINQFSVFTLMSNPTICMNDWLEQIPDKNIWHKIIIPAEIKGEIRDKLDQSNINERVLFPGLDGLAKLLTRHYSPRTSNSPGGCK